MENYMKQKVELHLTSTMGVKPHVAKAINLSGLFATIIKVANLERTDEYVNGEPLTEYKLDSRLKRFVLPRGVYVDTDLLALNHVDKDTYRVEEADVLSASEFQVVQTQLLGACRKVVSFDSNLKEASEPLTLAEAAKRTASDGLINYSGEVVMPINVKIRVYQDFWYNYPVDEMINRLVAEVVSSLR